MPKWIGPAVLPFVLAGCTHLQLERSTNNQIRTLTDLQYTQVLSNVAMFQRNPDALPFFALTASGIAQITDMGSSTDTAILNVLPGGVWGGNFGGMVSRAVQENWTVTPVTDPDKLKTMRCAYQKLMGCHWNDCDNCAKKLQDHFCAKECKEKDPKESPAACEACNNCAVPVGWYCSGRKCDVPKTACYVGHYCDVYVWVMPEGVDGLTRFTLAILDIATAVPSPPDTAQVKRIYPDGNVTGPPEKTEVIHTEGWSDGKLAPGPVTPRARLAPMFLAPNYAIPLPGSR